MFASSIEEPRRRGGLSIWFAAAGSLVLGILIGFASGYRAGQDRSGEKAAAGQPFSESAVPEPVRVDPEPIVPSPETARSAPRDLSPTRNPAHTTAVGRVPPPIRPGSGRPEQSRGASTGASGGGPAIPATGPGSLQVISRPAGAQVILDGRAVGRTPLSMADVAAGEHSIRLELPGFNRWATTVDVKAGSPIRVTASLEQ